jgi:hypothetical protein
MTRALGTEITDGVIAALRQIAPENGYRTSAGLRVYRGRTDLIADSATDTYPAILVHCARDNSLDRNRRQALKERGIEIQGITRAATEGEFDEILALDYEPILDDLAEDIDRALLTLTDRDALEGRAVNVTISGAEYEPPPEGSWLVFVRFTLTVSYVLRYERT